MEVFGRVQNGVVVLEEPAALPDGARVRVTRATLPRIRTAAVQRPVALPIFDYDGPPDIDLSNARVAEILDRDDASA
jgi:hypothetical protein